MEEEFFERFTDGCDKENEYYDSSFTNHSPSEIWAWIESKLGNQCCATGEGECTHNHL